MHEIFEYSSVFWLAHRAKTGDIFFYLGPMPSVSDPELQQGLQRAPFAWLLAMFPKVTVDDGAQII